MPQIKAFFDDKTSTVTYLVWDPATKAAAIIDPVLDYEPHAARLTTASVDAVLDIADDLGLKVVWALDTHAHADHLSAAHHVRDITGAKVGIGARITEVQRVFSSMFHASDVCHDGGAFDALFKNDESFALGDLTVHVLHTPGRPRPAIAIR